MNKFFCYFNLVESFICKISPLHEEPTESIISFEISENEAIDFLSGKKSPHDWTVTRENGEWALIKRAVFALKSKAEQNKVIQLLKSSFTLDSDVHVIIAKDHIDVYIKNESVTSTVEPNIEMYITPKDDNSFVLATININLIELRKKIQYTNGVDTKHVRQRITRHNNNISIFMEYIFPTMTLEYADDL